MEPVLTNTTLNHFILHLRIQESYVYTQLHTTYPSPHPHYQDTACCRYSRLHESYGCIYSLNWSDLCPAHTIIVIKSSTKSRPTNRAEGTGERGKLGVTTVTSEMPEMNKQFNELVALVKLYSQILVSI